MSTYMFRTFILILEYSCNTQYHILRKKKGVVEKKNRSLKELASSMLHARSIPQKPWDEALNCANYIQNRPPHRSVKD
jgi:hypothetical protein